MGVYISVPFCRTKCSYCNFASDVFSRVVFDRYVGRVCGDISRSAAAAEEMGGKLAHEADSVYLGGGTPTVLDPDQLLRMFEAVGRNFELLVGAEITVECAPGTLTDPVVETLVKCGVNRVSLGVQSFVDQEAAAVGRLHKRSTVVEEMRRLRSAGIENINVDLIAGLPHQTRESWEISLEETIATGVPHVSVYMLEVDEDSRLGRELIAGGTKYHAHFVPDENVIADFYERAQERLKASGIRQYEISNFARDGWESRHNLKYWTRQPYVGFGVDAHSMLRAEGGTVMRFATPDSLEEYVAGKMGTKDVVMPEGGLEESFFLGLRLNRGVDLETLEAEFGEDALGEFADTIDDLVNDEVLERQGGAIRLTPRGRLLSNEVFERFIAVKSR